MRKGEVFGGTYLKAADLGKHSPNVTISEYKIEEIGGDRRLVLYFKGKDRGLVCNRTNANMIEEIAGTDEMDEWIGKAIRLYVTRVDFQGKRVDAIRVSEATGQPQPVPLPPLPGDDEDSVPF